MAHAIHPFERTGNGSAPFRYLGFSREVYQAVPGDPECPIQPGATCDHCGTGIMNVCHIESADGRRFKVGSSCVQKTSDPSLIKGASADQKADDRKRRAAATRRKDARDMLRIWTAWNQFDAVRDAFAAEPHPQGFTDRETGCALTLVDWAEWMIENAGTRGRLAVAKRIEKVLADLRPIRGPGACVEAV